LIGFPQEMKGCVCYFFETIRRYHDTKNEAKMRLFVSYVVLMENMPGKFKNLKKILFLG